MKVSELIKDLSEQPQDAEVFFLENGNGMCEISKVKSLLDHLFPEIAKEVEI